jgi:hypothetical protein
MLALAQVLPPVALPKERIAIAPLDGTTWVYPHPRNPSQFGEVELQFSGNEVKAKHRTGGSAGLYVLRDDFLRLFLENWGTNCYVLLNEGGKPVLFFPQGGLRAPVEIKATTK